MTDPRTPNVSHPNLDGVLSPQTIAQSARDGVPISGRDPAPAQDRINAVDVSLNASSADVVLNASGKGTAHVFLWSGEKGYIPVFLTSCSIADDPPPDYGLTACAPTDGGIPPWSPDMSGRVVGEASAAVSAGRTRVSIQLDAAARQKLAQDGSALISFETPNDEVQALDVPLGG